MPSVGEIHSVIIYFENNPQDFKIRPVLIIDIDANTNICTFAEITSSGPKNPPSFYDQFKEPIYKWKEAGLEKLSFVKTHRIHKAHKDKFVIFNGNMNEQELNRILYRIVEVNSN